MEIERSGLKILVSVLGPVFLLSCGTVSTTYDPILTELDLRVIGRIRLRLASDDIPPTGIQLEQHSDNRAAKLRLSVPPPHIGTYSLISLEWRVLDSSSGILFCQLSLGEVGTSQPSEEWYSCAIRLAAYDQPREVFSRCSAVMDRGVGQRKLVEGYRLHWNETTQTIEIQDCRSAETVWADKKH